MGKTQLKQERLNRGWTLEYVGQKLGISNQAVSQIETGKRKPSHDVLLKLLKLFNVEHEALSALFAPAGDEHQDSSTARQ